MSKPSLARRTEALRAIAIGLFAASVACLAVPGCSASDEASERRSTGEQESDVFGKADASSCVEGAACGDGGVCAGNVCCAAERACGGACCGGSDVCAFQKCVAAGAACADSTDCPDDSYCDYALGVPAAPAPATGAGCSGGAPPRSGRCLPRPPICAADGAGAGVSCLSKCEHRTKGSFEPVLRFAWGGQLAPPHATDVMMTPIVISLDDDNCDGKVNQLDIPEILFTTFANGGYTGSGTLHAISVVQGKLVDKWSAPGISPMGQLAGGDFDGKPGNEVVACGADGRVHAYGGGGTLLWKSGPIGCQTPSLADLDADGKPEVIVEGGILDGATGATKHTFSTPLVGQFVVSDVDGDGDLDIVTASQAFDGKGQLFVSTGSAGSFSAIGDFDRDGRPEVVAVHTSRSAVSFWRYDAAAPGKFAWVRQNVSINAGLPQHCSHTVGGGPPTVADFDGDGVPDVALAGGVGYTVLSGARLVNPAVEAAKVPLWAVPTTDCSSAATGSSVFDFDGDGKAEVVYSDELRLRIYEGPTGKVLFETCNTTGTLIEYPVIADVDNDGHADIVVVSNGYIVGNAASRCSDGAGVVQSGVRVFGDAAGTWARTRSIWNQHAYHVTNVNDDGTIPRSEVANWKRPGLNNFRQNKQPGGEFAAPDAVVSLAPSCAEPYALVATVKNLGEAALPAGLDVGFYAGAADGGRLLGTLKTTRSLHPAQSERVVLALPDAPAEIKGGQVELRAVVDDHAPARTAWHECRTDNNTSPPASGACNVVR